MKICPSAGDAGAIIGGARIPLENVQTPLTVSLVALRGTMVVSISTVAPPAERARDKAPDGPAENNRHCAVTPSLLRNVFAGPGAIVPPFPVRRVQVLVAVQAYRLLPGVALLRKNSSPVVQIAGMAVPTFIGRVEGESPKSTLLDWLRKSTLVCAGDNAQVRISDEIQTIILFFMALRPFCGEGSATRVDGATPVARDLNPTAYAAQRGPAFAFY
jgi:hypothetical protein